MAVWPPAEVLDRIAALDRPEGPGVRWTGRDQWHVTVRFLGAVDEAEAVAALGRVRAAAGEAVVGPKLARLGRGVVCLPVSGLEALAAAVTEATAEVGRPPEDRPFRGHLTLARLKGHLPRGVVGMAFEAAFPVREVALVRSGADDGPARYTTLAIVPLGER